MTFDLSRLSNPLDFAENRRPAHSDHRWFTSEDEAATGQSSFEQCLNGVWKFHYAKNPSSAPEGFEAPGFDTSGWDDIPVPAHIQLQGYDRPQYVNTQYPWDGHETLEPGQAPTRFNPTASYVTTFTLDQPLAEGERLAISFQGAESALALWVNGTWIGYSCDSFTPSEFDITDALVEGENTVAARVFKWSAASWLEDQDFYRFSGLFRDVMLYRRPATHLEDMRVTTTIDRDDFSSALVAVQTKLEGAGSVRARLEGVGDLTDAGEGRLQVRVDDPHLWSAEDPHLYRMVLEVLDESGAVSEVVVQRVGIRRFGIEDGLMKINGKRIVFVGVNRHEFGLQGRVMSREQTVADMVLLKANNVNAIRTSHYPNNTFFYELADEFGFYVIDEMNLETHGLWDEIEFGKREIADAVPGDNPDWYPALEDRATSFLERDKNHPSIVIWSLGNESYGGTNLLNLSDFFREFDPTRPVHYEGVNYDRRHQRTTDMVSQMYTPADKVAEQLKENRDKPFILCEYAHVMGNSFGAVDKYIELAYSDELYQGGFIWDFSDQAIALVDRHGQAYFGYGGDCGEAPHDSDFCGNGILFADHTPKPVVQEMKYLYQGFKMSVEAGEFTLTNRLLFTSSSAYECVVTLAREGRRLASAVVETDVAPGETGSYLVPLDKPVVPGEYTVEVSFRLREGTSWAPAGHEVAYEQGVFTVEGEARPKAAPKPELVEGIHNIGVRGRHFEALFSRIHGGLMSYRYGATPDGGREMLRSIPRPNFWHAPTSNENGWRMQERDGQWLLASQYANLRRQDGVANPRVAEVDDCIEVSYDYVLASNPATECDVVYRVDGEGRIEVSMTVRPGEGMPDAPEFALLMTTQPEFNQMTWYGEGPLECYVDRRGGARLDVHSLDVRENLTPYLRPQEAGSRTGVRWATVTDTQGRGLRFEADEPMEFSALPWTPVEIESADHHVDLPPIQRTVLRPALMRRGVGGDQSWGAMTHPEYCLPTGELSFMFAFQGVL
ncbi:glycoside hydrolase family 2 TIM barrel-domain containing protein [Aestuariimicrobium ganziense]|uniref:glycoside hydrolase family 2 TIM barrel-domain containing protein n=1 Tax=Aestuariimicrobium ganziense TaxID=2773677 RepID=UPI001940C01F|nr:glycoside hydrolase family 2 TIM barrel-domain containing protein [Aestuariimicrobium ganziense]